MKFRDYRALLFSFFVGLCALQARASDQIPAPPQMRPIALVGGAIYPVSGPVVEEGTVLFVDGEIAAVGRQVELPGDVETIDVAGRRVWSPVCCQCRPVQLNGTALDASSRAVC